MRGRDLVAPEEILGEGFGPFKLSRSGSRPDPVQRIMAPLLTDVSVLRCGYTSSPCFVSAIRWSTTDLISPSLASCTRNWRSALVP